MYKLITIPADPDQQEICIAILSDAGYDGFEQTADELKAYISLEKFNESLLRSLSEETNFTFQITDIPDINWNATWEANFSPIKLHDFCGIRATFHQPIQEVQYEIIITPKMAFGTGHHATTYLMLQHMQLINFTGAKVLDFGTGTGILAILAAKMGAGEVTAIDNDDYAIENAKENCLVNNVNNRVTILHNDHICPGKYDIILANINRNILLKSISLFEQYISSAGILLMSGLLAPDVPAILHAADHTFWKTRQSFEKDNWMLLQWKTS